MQWRIFSPEIVEHQYFCDGFKMNFRPRFSNGGRIEWVIRLRKCDTKFYHFFLPRFFNVSAWVQSCQSNTFFFKELFSNALNQYRPRDSNVQLHMKQYFPAFQIVISGVPNDGFLLNALKTLFSLSRVLLYL